MAKAPYFGLRGPRLHSAIGGVSCVAIMIFGYNNVSAPSLVVFPSFYEQFPQMNIITTTGEQNHYNATITGTVIALYTLLGTFGALGCTFLGDVWGRRWTIWVSCLVQAIGCILMASSFQFAQFIVARIILGLGTGGIIATVSVWQAETAKASSRGEHVSAFGIYCGMGLLLALWLVFGCSYISNSASWRFPLAVPILLGAIVMSLILSMPESPRWLVKMGRADEAAEVMSIIYDCDPQDDEVQLEIRDIQVALELNQKSTSLMSMFKMGPQRIFHRVCLAAACQMFLQLTGTNAIAYYCTTLFELELGFGIKLASILSACLMFTVVLGSGIASYTVDRYGRRPLMLISAALTTISMACIAALSSNPEDHAALKAAVFFVYFFGVAYCIGFLGLPFLYASEIAPVHMRAAVCGVATAVSWLFNFLVVEVTPVGFTSIGWQYFLVYMCTNAAAGIAVYFFYPETAGRTLEEIDEIFTKSKSIFDPVRVAKTLPKQHLATFLRKEAEHDEEVKESIQQVVHISTTSSDINDIALDEKEGFNH